MYEGAMDARFQSNIFVDLERPIGEGCFTLSQACSTFMTCFVDGSYSLEDDSDYEVRWGGSTQELKIEVVINVVYVAMHKMLANYYCNDR